MSVCLSVRTQVTTLLPLDGLHEVWYWSIFQNSVEMIQVLLKSDKNSEYFTRIPIHFILSYLAQFLFKCEMFQKNALEKIKTHILYSISFFFLKSCLLWDNVEKCCIAGQAIDDNMAHVHCMLDTWRYKRTLRICNTYSFPLQKRLHEHASVLRYSTLPVLLIDV